MLKALHEASVWLDDMENRPEQAEIVSRADLHQLPAGADPRPPAGPLRLRRRPQERGSELHDLQQRNCNYPQPKYANWWLTQFRRWGMVDGAPDYEGVAKQVMRTDIYEEAMKEIGVHPRRRERCSRKRCSTA